MITSVKKSNAAEYSNLYEQATEYLMSHDTTGAKLPAGEYGGSNAIMKYLTNEDGDFIDEDGNVVDREHAVQTPISSLQEYFSYIEELSAADMVYTILPLDEDHFEINADTREILVPDAFKSNGISIQGDVISEIVYFRINRFYDATDLGERNIYIEWEAANGQKGVSVPCVVDLKSEPNFVLFGWPIAKELTEAAGNVTFSVRFYTINKASQKVDYSFATLPQTVTIKASLNYDLTNLQTTGVMIDNSQTLIKSRFENTTPTTSTAVAEEPQYIVNLNADEHVVKTEDRVLADIEEASPITISSADMDPDENEFKSRPFKAQVAAFAPDAGTITYTLQKLNLDTKIAMETEEHNKPVVEFIPTKDKTRTTGKLYYYLTTNDRGEQAYLLYRHDLTDEAITEHIGANGVVYEKAYTFTVDGIGYYTVTAKNRVRTAHKSKDSVTLEIPRPTTPHITTNVVPVDQLDPDKEEFYLTLGVEAEDTTKRGKLTYQWFYMPSNGTEFAPIVGTEAAPSTNRTYKIKGYITREAVYTDPEKKDTIDHYNYTIVNGDGVATGDGYYFCLVTNNLNRKIDMIASDVIRISHKAMKPVVTSVSKENMGISQVDSDGKPTLEVKGTVVGGSGEDVAGWRYETPGTVIGAHTQRAVDMEDEEMTAEVAGWQSDKADEITYQWYRYVASGHELAADKELAAQGLYEVNHDRNMAEYADEKIAEHTRLQANNELGPDPEVVAYWEAFKAQSQTPAFDPDAAGTYFCLVTNKYNGSEASTISRFFTVTPDK